MINTKNDPYRRFRYACLWTGLIVGVPGGMLFSELGYLAAIGVLIWLVLGIFGHFNPKE